jgi:hypothetical protein
MNSLECQGMMSRCSAVVLAGALFLSACGGASKPTEIKLTAPDPGAALSVGQSVAIVGTATGDAVSRVDVIIDGTTYATLNAPDKSKGVPSFPVNVPWTPLAAGTHAIQLKAFGPPDDKLLAQSEPLVINAQPAAVQAAPTEAPAPAPTQAVVPTAAPAAGGSAGQPAQPQAQATAAPAPANDAPSLTVTNEFVNVRTGPSIEYERIGSLNQGQTAPVKGKSQDGQWWQISFPSGAGGIGWVFGQYVEANAAGRNVPVASAPPLPPKPTSPPQPAQQPVLVPIVTLPPPSVVQPQPQPAPASQLVGGKGILRVEANPVASGATAYATWNIPNFKSGVFDKGDGQGFKGPIAQVMRVDIPGVTGARTIALKWTDLNNQEQTDSLTLNVIGQAAQPQPVAGVNPPCDANNPDWQASKGGNPADWKFCKRRDFEYVGEDPGNVANVPNDKTYNMAWDIYGPVNGIYIVLQPDGSRGPQAGGSGKSFPATGTGGSYSTSGMPGGCYKLFLRIYLNDGGQTTFGEKYVCIGGGASTGGSSPTNTPAPSGQATATAAP